MVRPKAICHYGVSRDEGRLKGRISSQSFDLHDQCTVDGVFFQYVVSRAQHTAVGPAKSPSQAPNGVRACAQHRGKLKHTRRKAGVCRRALCARVRACKAQPAHRDETDRVGRTRAVGEEAAHLQSWSRLGKGPGIGYE